MYISVFFCLCLPDWRINVFLTCFFSRLGRNITCTTNLPPSGVVQVNDVITMTCRMTYSGNWAPAMRWSVSNARYNFTDDDATTTVGDTLVTSQLTVAASVGLHGSEILCVTYFAEPLSALPTTATNIPTYPYHSWTSSTLNVRCKCFNIC